MVMMTTKEGLRDLHRLTTHLPHGGRLPSPFEDLIELLNERLFEGDQGAVGRGWTARCVGERGEVEGEKDLARVAFRCGWEKGRASAPGRHSDDQGDGAHRVLRRGKGMRMRSC